MQHTNLDKMNFIYTNNIYIIIIEYMIYMLNLDLQFKFCLIIMYSTVIIYTL